MSKEKLIKDAYDEAIPFLDVYPNYDLNSLPFWVRDNINSARISGKTKKSVIMPDGRRYNLSNKLNHLSGQEWTYFINSVFCTRYPTNGKESYAHKIRKIHPTPKPPQLMRDLILFFTKEKDLVFDTFMGVGGTLLGAALCNRKAAGIDLNEQYIKAYKDAVKELNLKEFPTYVGDSIKLTSNEQWVKDVIKDEKISLLLIDPPYGNMMNLEKTGADIEVYGKSATPFTNLDCDLGNMTRKSFLEALKKSVQNLMPYIKKDGHVVVFIKDLQPKGKEINMLHYEVVSKLNEIDNLNYKGMKIWADESAKLYPYGYPFSFVANQIHQYILVFRKEK